MKKLLHWLDENIIKIALIGYIFFIPLFPKLPFKMVNYTYIALRLEDFYVFFLTILFIIQVYRKKITLQKKFVIPFLLFWIAVFISFLWGFFVQKTIEFKHLGFLHSIRRIEYMINFFFFASSIRKKEDFLFYLKALMGVVMAVSIYGLGQKYLGWPAVQTMNPEYAKGYLLVLDANARISSTFGGHYDLAAFLIFLIPVILGCFLAFGNYWYFFIFFLALFSLVLTASRISYGAYLLSTIPFLLFTRKFKILFVVVLLTIGLTSLSGNLTKRLTRTFQQKQIFIDKTTGQTTVPRRLKPDELPIGDFVPNKNMVVGQATGVNAGMLKLNPKDVADTKANLRDDIVNEAKLSGKTLTPEEENRLVEEAFNNLKVVSTVLPDISFSTRLQVEWPRALNAFLKNPILGKGPSSITEATDNDYLRWLGEYGLFGTLTFLYIFFLLAKTIILKINQVSKKESYLLIGLLFGFFGLLGNATYIDVFEASKVAYMFWMTMGIFIGWTNVMSSKSTKTNK